MMGFGTVRGSSFHGGSAALRELVSRARSSNLTITPDGPRGPRRRLAPGCVFLAGTLGIPIVAMGLGYDRPWRMKTWDRFAVPRPWSHARAIISRAIHVPPGLDRDGIERHRVGIERILVRLSDDAERWAGSGLSRAGDRAARPEPSRVAAWATRSAARSRTRARAPRRAAPPERCGVSLPARRLPDGRGLSARPPRPPHAEQF